MHPTALDAMETTDVVDEPSGPSRLRRTMRMAGESIGQWRVERTLGVGAMGIVYAVRDPESGQRAAIKVLHARGYEDDTTSGAWLRHEARALARLSHPGIVAVRGVGELEGVPFMVMELIEGTTLAGWLSARRRRPAEIARVFRDVADAVAAAHEAGLVHGDLKPDNIMVDASGHVRVMDFGLAEALGPGVEPTIDLDDSTDDLDAEATRRNASTPRGTPAYMAPERLSGGPGDARTDQFSLCVTFYEALYGRRPFRGRTPAELYFRATRPVLRVAPPDRNVPAWLDAIVTRGLAADPDARWPDVRRLVRALDVGLRRRCVRRWSGFGAIAALGLVGLFAATSVAAAACPAPPEPIRTWSVKSAAELGDAMVDAGRSPASAHRVRVVLDAEVHRTRALRTAACRPGRLHRGRTAAARDELRQREAELAAAIEAVTANPGHALPDLADAADD